MTQSAVRSPQSSIAVTGIGIVSPIGVGRRQFWNALCAGRSGVAPVEGLARADGVPSVAARVRDFAAREFITSPHFRRMDALSRMVVAAARMALDDARVRLDPAAADRVGVVFGSAFGDNSESVQHLDRVFDKGPAAASPMVFPNLVLNAPASYVSIEFGLTGVNLTVAQGEVSGEVALVQGCDLLGDGAADLVLAGAADEIGSAVVAATHHARALAGQRGGAEWASPYDAARGGVVLGEGAAMLVLEPLARARARGATVYACIAETAAFAVPAPLYDWPARIAAVPPALAALAGRAGVDLVCGAANSSKRLDACEIDLFARLVGGNAVLTSIKGAVGEFGSAGALTIAAACLAVHAQTAPPLCHLNQPLPVGELRLAATRAEAHRIERALVCGLARGGAGAAVVLERA
jgi:3-oxoacyl-[acyl-carrier-protein] synthase II